jgi:hypothetical protein
MLMRNKFYYVLLLESVFRVTTDIGFLQIDLISCKANRGTLPTLFGDRLIKLKIKFPYTIRVSG